MRYFILLIILSATVNIVCSQDKIIKNDKTIIECKVTEIGLDAIKYKLIEEGLSEDLILSISIDEVNKIVFSNGREMFFSNPLDDPNLYANDHKNAIKINWMSPVVGFLGFAYEKSIRPGKSIEHEIGFIGIGYSIEQTSGVFFSTGLKYFKTPDFHLQRMKYSHILKGSYIKPQAFLAIYGYDYYSYYSNSNEDQNIVAGAIVFNLGRQIVYGNTFLMDYSFGVGYGFNIHNNPNGFRESTRLYHYGFTRISDEIPLALTAKLKIGFLFK